MLNPPIFGNKVSQIIWICVVCLSYPKKSLNDSHTLNETQQNLALTYRAQNYPQSKIGYFFSKAEGISLR